MDAVDNLGRMSEHGLGESRDEAKARALYIQAAEEAVEKATATIDTLDPS